MDRLTSIEVFLKVADTGGFSAAGRRLNMSVTMVSNHVKALEDRLGARLLNRTTRKVSLTETGRAYYERASRVCADLDEADVAAGEARSTPRGTLRIYTMSAIVRYVSPVIAEYLETWPDVSVDFTTGERWVDLVEHGYDLAIRTTPAPDSSLIVKRINPWRHVLCCSPSYLETHESPLSPNDLTAHNCLQYSFYPYGDDWRFLDQNGEVASIRVSGSVTTNSAETLRQLALRGIGLFLAPSFVVSEDLASGALITIMPDFRAVERTIDALYPHRRHLSAKVRVFIDLLARRFAGNGAWMNPN